MTLPNNWFEEFKTNNLEFLFRYAAPNIGLAHPDRGLVVGRAQVLEAFKADLFGCPFSTLNFEALGSSAAGYFFRFRDSTLHGIVEFNFNDKNLLQTVQIFFNSRTWEQQWRPPIEKLPALPDGLKLFTMADAKTVSKPWGYELWFVHDSAPFAYKLISVKAGTRTSLQYHVKKEEASLLVSGKIRLHFAEKAGMPLSTSDFEAGAIWHVKPGTVHRVEALSDVVFIEVSTPELDDVVRLQDDLGRGNGHISAEHQTRKTRA